MNDHSREFFIRLAETPQPLLHDVVATFRIDIEEKDGGPPWHLTVDHGRVAVSRSDAPADAVMRTDRAAFEEIVSGEANALTAALRGRLRIDGNPRLLVAFKNLLPGPPQRRTKLPPPIGSDEAPPGTTTRGDGKENP